MDTDREVTTVGRVLVVATAVSLAHDTDNTVRFDDYVDGGTPGFITQTSIPVLFVVFTAVAVAAYLLLRRGERATAAGLLVVYSTGRLIGPLHYTDVPPADFDLYQNVLIVADFGVGVLVVAVALRVALRRRRVSAAATPPRAS